MASHNRQNADFCGPVYAARLDRYRLAGPNLCVRAKIPTSSAPKVALVLAGGAARGAYEVGVIQHLVEEVSHDLGLNVPLPILCGTSVGAINACTMAAYADEPVRTSWSAIGRSCASRTSSCPDRATSWA